MADECITSSSSGSGTALVSALRAHSVSALCHANTSINMHLQMYRTVDGLIDMLMMLMMVVGRGEKVVKVLQKKKLCSPPKSAVQRKENCGVNSIRLPADKTSVQLRNKLLRHAK